MWRVACSGGSALSHVVSTWFTRGIDDKCHQPCICPKRFFRFPKNLPPQQEAQMQRKRIDLPHLPGWWQTPSAAWYIGDRWACDASMNLEDLQILFIQEGDLLLRLVVLRVHNWECPISRFSVDIMTMVDTWLSCDFFHLHGNLSEQLCIRSLLYLQNGFKTSFFKHFPKHKPQTFFHCTTMVSRASQIAPTRLSAALMAELKNFPEAREEGLKKNIKTIHS